METAEKKAEVPAKTNSPTKEELVEVEPVAIEPPYKMEKSQEEILAQGNLQNFFECPNNNQEVIFMMVKADYDGLRNSDLYMKQ